MPPNESEACLATLHGAGSVCQALHGARLSYTACTVALGGRTHHYKVWGLVNTPNLTEAMRRNTDVTCWE